MIFRRLGPGERGRVSVGEGEKSCVRDGWFIVFTSTLLDHLVLCA